MKKSVRINLLVITIVVTLVVFAGLWYLRPGVSDVILQQARVRQSQPLMEITEPLRKPKAEDLIDTTELSKNLKREIVPSITEAVKAELLADPTFVRSEVERIAVSSLKSELEPAIKSALLSDAGFAASVSKQVNVEPLQSRIQPAIKSGVASDLSRDSGFIKAVSSQVETASAMRAQESAIAAVKRTNDQMISSLRAEVNAQIAAIPATTIISAGDLEGVDVNRVVALAVDQQIPTIVEAVVGRIEANRDLYLEAFRAAFGSVVREDEVVDLYIAYRNDLVQDLVPVILDDIEAQLKGEVPPSRKVVEESVPPMAVVEVEAVPTVPVVATPPVPSAPSAQVKQTPVAPKETPVAPEETPVAPEEAAVAPEETAVVVAPAVPEVPSVGKITTESMGEAEYEAERQKLRTEAIDAVLRLIGE